MLAVGGGLGERGEGRELKCGLVVIGVVDSKSQQDFSGGPEAVRLKIMKPLEGGGVCCTGSISSLLAIGCQGASSSFILRYRPVSDAPCLQCLGDQSQHSVLTSSSNVFDGRIYTS
jgi:hypothetical protein